MKLEQLTTEGRNPASEAIDSLTPLEIVRLMGEQLADGGLEGGGRSRRAWCRRAAKRVCS